MGKSRSVHRGSIPGFILKLMVFRGVLSRRRERGKRGIELARRLLGYGDTEETDGER